MRRRVSLFLVVTAGMVLVLVVPGVREALADVEFFRVDLVTVEGADYLEAEDVLRTAAVPEEASVWDDFEAIETRLQSHAGIHTARVGRRLPGELVLEVVERQPVAFLPTPTLTPVDAEGRPLPISPIRRAMDLPLLQPYAGVGPDGAPLTPAQIRALASEMDRLSRLDPATHSSVSEAALGPDGDVLLHLADPRVVMRYHPPLLSRRLDEALMVLADAMERRPDRTLVSVDLRFADQVVVQFTDPGAE